MRRRGRHTCPSQLAEDVRLVCGERWEDRLGSLYKLVVIEVSDSNCRFTPLEVCGVLHSDSVEVKEYAK